MRPRASKTISRLKREYNYIMSSHHAMKFFITHYEQIDGAIKRRAIKAEIRKLQREEDALKWSDYRRKRAVIKAATEFAYYSDVAFGIGFLITVLSIVLYGLRNI